VAESDRIVVVTSGFGVWTGGRPGPAVPWRDVTRVVALRRAVAGAVAVHLRVTLVDGRALEMHDRMAGWGSFLQAAPERLSPMPAAAAWWPAAIHPELGDSEIVLYERATGAGRRVRGDTAGDGG
jgi:hypothetical protein